MARNEQLIRQLTLYNILEAHRYGLTLDDLRQELIDSMGLSSLSTRTVRRDLYALRSSGFDILDEERGGRTVWKLGPLSRKKVRIQASAMELLALSLGRELLLPLAGTPIGQGIESFWNRIQEELPDGVWGHYRKLRQVLHVLGVPAKTYDKKKGIISTISRAILNHQVIKARYQSLDKPPRQRRIEPYAMALWQGSLYVIGADAELSTDDPHRVRHWKIDRFRRAETLDERFHIPAGFDLEKFLSRSMGGFAGERVETYRIRLSARAAEWVREDPWQAQQKLQEESDGSFILTVTAPHPMAVIPRVLALGREATLLEPPEAREEIAKILQETAARY